MNFFERIFTDLKADRWVPDDAPTLLFADKRPCAVCRTVMSLDTVYATLQLDDLYEVCSEECKRVLPDIVAQSLREAD